VTNTTTDQAIAAIDEFIRTSKIDTKAKSWRTRLRKPPKQQFDDARTYYWDLETNHGPVKVELLAGVAPMHVTSTIYLTRLGFYDGLAFHRVIPGFMAQGGCPVGRGTGGPGYEYDGECDRSARHDARGVLSMANRGPGTDGSQFFLTFVATPHLDGNHTVFGRVVGGMETLDALEQRGSRSGATSEPLRIERASVSVE